MGLFSFRLEMRTKNLEQFDELQARVKDFSIPFMNIISEWARGNQNKFDKAKGAELTGVRQPPVYWQPVSIKYHDQKHGPIVRGNRQLFKDWLMVRTGDLMRSLTSEGGFAQHVSAMKAIFGRPLSSDDADKAMHNKESRPTIFLGRSDKLMIKKEMQNYLSLGGNYKALLFGRSIRREALLNQSAQMDVAFAETVA